VIRDDDTVAQRLEERNLLAPKEGSRGEAVREEQDRLASSRGRVVVCVVEAALGLGLLVVVLVHCFKDPEMDVHHVL
jgi:hypothetical protein